MQLTIAIQSIAYTTWNIVGHRRRRRHDTMSSKIANWHFTMTMQSYMVFSTCRYASCRVHKSFLCFILAKAMWLRLKLIRANTMPIRQFFGEEILFFRRDKSGCLNTMYVDGSHNKYGGLLVQFLLAFCRFIPLWLILSQWKIKWNLITFHLFVYMRF